MGRTRPVVAPILFIIVNAANVAAITTTTTIAIVATVTIAAAEPQPDLLWVSHGVENVVSITHFPDIDGDGLPDVLYESYDAGAPQTDHLFAIQGSSSGLGDVIWSARPLGGPSNSGGYGDNCLRVGPDLNGDGFPDVLYGAAWGNRSAFALDGRTGATLWSFDTYSESPPTPAESGWVYAIASLDQDLDDDGVPEILFCTGSENDGVYCVSGASGAVIWRYQGLDGMFEIRSIVDLDGDGIRDVIVGVGDNFPRVIALSGDGGPSGAGSVIWQRDTGSVFSIIELPDQNDDGLPEVAVGSWDLQIHCFSGIDGQTLWDGPVGSNVMRVARLDDVNGDDYPDLAVGSWSNTARVYDGRNGSLIWSTPVGSLNGGDVWAIDRVGDTTGDGINEVCAGSFDEKVYLMDGVTGEILWSYSVGNRVLTVRGVPDISGNGIPDVVAGTQKLSSSPGGDCYAFEGGEPTVSIEPIFEAGMTGTVRISPGRPNPFMTSTRWTLDVREPGDVRVLLYAPSGRRVAILAIPGEGAISGRYSLDWDGQDEAGRVLPSGVYHLRLLVDGAVAAEQKAVLVR